MTFRFSPEGDVASVCDHRMAMNKCNRYIMSVFCEAAVGKKKKKKNIWSHFLKKDVWHASRPTGSLSYFSFQFFFWMAPWDAGSHFQGGPTYKQHKDAHYNDTQNTLPLPQPPHPTHDITGFQNKLTVHICAYACIHAHITIQIRVTIQHQEQQNVTVVLRK